MGFSPDSTGIFNRYSYVLNDPVNGWDPSGEFPIYKPHPNDVQMQFGKGVIEGATGMYTAYQFSKRLDQGEPRALFIYAGLALGKTMALNHPSTAVRMALKGMRRNPSRIAGRVAGSSAVSILLARAVGKFGKALGGGRAFATIGSASIGATNFSAGQVAAATTALGGLYDQIVEAGFNPGNITNQALGDAAIVSATGGAIEFNSETGEIIVEVPTSISTPRIRARYKIGQIKDD